MNRNEYIRLITECLDRLREDQLRTVLVFLLNFHPAENALEGRATV